MNQEVETIMQELESLSNPSRIKHYKKNNEPEPFFGVMMGPLRKLGKEQAKKTDLALALWASKNLDAQLLSIMMMEPNKLSEDEIRGLVATTQSLMVLDELVSKVISKRRDAKSWKEEFLASDSELLQRLGWGLEVRYIVSKKASQSELEDIFETIKKELKTAPEQVQWTMNRALVEIGVTYDEWTEECIDLGYELNVLKGIPVPPGCTSPFAPEWITVARKNKETRSRKIKGK